MTFPSLSMILLILLALCAPDGDAAMPARKKRIAVLEFKDGPGVAPEWRHAGLALADLVRQALTKSGRCLIFADSALTLTGTLRTFDLQHRDVNPDFHSGIEKETARCVLELRLIDTTTGHLIASGEAVGDASAHQATEDTDRVAPIPLRDARFAQTLIGQATHQAMAQAVTFTEKHLAALPWYGNIVKTEDRYFFVNTGVEDRRIVGDEFDVLRPGVTLLDPNTGDLLSTEQLLVGRIRLVAILGQRNARAIGLDQVALQVGDVIR